MKGGGILDLIRLFHPSAAIVSLTEKPGDRFALARCLGKSVG